MSRWARSGVLDRAFEQLRQAQDVQTKVDAVSLNSTSVKVHPDGIVVTDNSNATGHGSLDILSRNVRDRSSSSEGQATLQVPHRSILTST